MKTIENIDKYLNEGNKPLMRKYAEINKIGHKVKSLLQNIETKISEMDNEYPHENIFEGYFDDASEYLNNSILALDEGVSAVKDARKHR